MISTLYVFIDHSFWYNWHIFIIESLDFWSFLYPCSYGLAFRLFKKSHQKHYYSAKYGNNEHC